MAVPNSSSSKDEFFTDKVSEDGRFTPETGRYHLYASKFCPFAHRALLARRLKGLDEHIPVSYVHWLKVPVRGGWKFLPSEGYVDDLFNSERLQEIYEKARPGFEGKISVPVLWDKKENTIVSNMSDDISRMFLSELDSLPGVRKGVNLRPKELIERIDELVKWLHTDVNIGVYKVGFSRDQASYEREVCNLFTALNKLESIINENKDKGPYILGDKLTEVDLRAYPTIIRFDIAYVNQFRCNLGTIRGNYPAINAWLKNMYWNHKDFKETTWFDETKISYSRNMKDLNPLGITTLGPVPDIEPLDVEKKAGVAVPEVDEGKVIYGGRLDWDD